MKARRDDHRGRAVIIATATASTKLSVGEPVDSPLTTPAIEETETIAQPRCRTRNVPAYAKVAQDFQQLVRFGCPEREGPAREARRLAGPRRDYGAVPPSLGPAARSSQTSSPAPIDHPDQLGLHHHRQHGRSARRMAHSSLSLRRFLVVSLLGAHGG